MLVVVVVVVGMEVVLVGVEVVLVAMEFALVLWRGSVCAFAMGYSVRAVTAGSGCFVFVVRQRVCRH